MSDDPLSAFSVEAAPQVIVAAAAISAPPSPHDLFAEPFSSESFRRHGQEERERDDAEYDHSSSSLTPRYSSPFATRVKEQDQYIPLPPSAQSEASQETTPTTETGVEDVVDSVPHRYPLHHAAATRKLSLLQILIDQVASLESVDDQGETALLKANHLQVVKLLVESGSNVEACDATGWKLLHIAASRGHLDIIRYLLELAGAAIDAQSNNGYTALMSAASKGNLPLVAYLIKKRADPLLRNTTGETALDIAASVFEVNICSLLEAYEETKVQEFDLFRLHSTIPVVVYENQRLRNRKWTTKALSRNDGRTAWTMGTLKGEESKVRPILKNEVELPIIGDENRVRLPSRREVRSGGLFGSRIESTVAEGKRPASISSPSSYFSTSSPRASTSASPSTSTSIVLPEAAYFWLSDWVVDVTDPSSSPATGWSYADSFDAPLEEWSSEPLEQLQRVLDGVAAGSMAGRGSTKKWVRRRRWVRLMRRRIDLAHWGFGEHDDDYGRDAGRDDYLSRARFLVDTAPSRATSSSASSSSGLEDFDRSETSIDKSTNTIVDVVADRIDRRRRAMRCSRAIEELTDGIATDQDRARRSLADELLQNIVQQLSSMQEELELDEEEVQDQEEGAAEEEGEEGDDFDDDARSMRTTTTSRSASFISSPSRSRSASASRAPSSRIDAHFSRSPTLSRSASISRSLAGSSPASPYSPDLALLHSLPELRVPTKEVPLPLSLPPSGAASGAQWIPDESATKCSNAACDRSFGFFLRRHHCRRCGGVFCARCSAQEEQLERDDCVGAVRGQWMSGAVYRCCDDCSMIVKDAKTAAAAMTMMMPPPATRSSTAAAAFSSSISTRMGRQGAPSLTIAPRSPSLSARSDRSELADCPVCGTTLATISSDSVAQEQHVQQCLDNSNGAVRTQGRYLVFTLPTGPLVGTECSICFESFLVGDTVARLSCLDYFHSPCIAAWMSRGNGCPFHPHPSTY